MTDSIYGVDMIAGISRCGNSPALYAKFLRRFPGDPSFISLRLSLEEGRLQDAFHFAHTLKGLAAQLGITALLPDADRLCALLRTGDAAALPEALSIYKRMAAQYEAVVQAISRLP